MKDVTPSRLPLLAGAVLIFTAICQILLATDRITAATAASGLIGVVVFGFLVSIVRAVVADAEPYEAYDRRVRSRS
jgi:hypothetical protein